MFMSYVSSELKMITIMRMLMIREDFGIFFEGSLILTDITSPFVTDQSIVVAMLG